MHNANAESTTTSGVCLEHHLKLSKTFEQSVVLKEPTTEMPNANLATRMPKDESFKQSLRRGEVSMGATPLPVVKSILGAQ